MLIFRLCIEMSSVSKRRIVHGWWWHWRSHRMPRRYDWLLLFQEQYVFITSYYISFCLTCSLSLRLFQKWWTNGNAKKFVETFATLGCKARYVLIIFPIHFVSVIFYLFFRRNKCIAIVQLRVVTLTNIVPNFVKTNKV